MPTLLLDKKICLANIERMALKARANQLSFRPHFKTHQSAEIGNWFRDFGVSAITVSSFRMAAYFAEAGWNDILVAFPFNPGDIVHLNRRSEKNQISILIDNRETLPLLKPITKKVCFYIDIDTGYGRTGVKSESVDQINEIIRDSQSNTNLEFSGFYCHAGHSYKAFSAMERDDIHLKAIADLEHLKNHFLEYSPKVLYGDTPNCSTQENFDGVDEITPGNFIFYDLYQHILGSCNLEDIAVAMACPMVGKYPDDQRLLIHGGAVHFSKESVHIDGRPRYGQLVNPTEWGWESPVRVQFINSLSQEHGILENCGEIFERIEIGDMLHFVPVHSCLTANLMRAYHTPEGEIITTLNS